MGENACSIITSDPAPKTVFPNPDQNFNKPVKKPRGKIKSCLPTNLKVIHINAQNATNKADELSLLCDDKDPDVFVVSEHGYNSETINLFKIENYELAANFNRTESKWGGVAIFTKNCNKPPCKNSKLSAY